MQITINMSDMPQEEPVAPAPEHIPTPEATPTQQEEGTPTRATSNVAAALAPLEEEIIDGEVTAIIEPDHKLTPKQPPYYLVVVGTVLACFLYLAASLLLPLLTPSATVLIIPVEHSITTTTAIQVLGRQLPALTLLQSQTTPATGKRYQDATEAQGTITFYNGQLAEVTIAAGTILTGKDGEQIITDQPATIPAANPPIEGQVTVPAHAVLAGASGNIPAYDINKACCVTSVLAKNTTAFTGGQSARDDIVVSRADINNAVTSLLTTLSQSEHAALQAQLTPGSDLITPSCTPHVSSDHKAGEEAREVNVTVSLTCTGIAYDAHRVDVTATQVITTNVRQTLGATYIPLGNIQVAIIHATITDQARGIATLRVKLDATYVYQLSEGEKQQLVKLIAGKTKQQAQALVSQEPGIGGVVITINDNAATLPDNPGKITIVIAERL